MALTGARADGPDDQYVGVYNTIQEADALSSNGQSSRALPKYREAETALLNFQKSYPDWNASVVEFRLRYVRTAISALLAKGPESTAPAPAAPAPTRPGTPATAPAAPAPDWQNQVNTLTDQMHHLQDDNASLQAKLKEALASQPGVTDPRQLAQADEKIKNLQKENDLLQVSLEQEKAKAASGAANQALEQARKALAQAGHDLDEQTKKANALEKEKTALQNKLNNLPASSYNDTESKTLRKDLEAANRKLAEQTKLAADLANEKQAMQASFKTMKADSEAAQALRSENQSLKKQVADLESSQKQLKSAQAAGSTTAPLTTKQEESKRVKKLQQERDDLRKQLELAQADLKSAHADAKTAAAATTTQEESKRIKKLQQERDDLRKQLEAANKDLKTRKGKASAAKVLEMEKQMASLRAKLDVLEATPGALYAGGGRPVPRPRQQARRNCFKTRGQGVEGIACRLGRPLCRGQTGTTLPDNWTKPRTDTSRSCARTKTTSRRSRTWLRLNWNLSICRRPRRTSCRPSRWLPMTPPAW